MRFRFNPGMRFFLLPALLFLAGFHLVVVTSSPAQTDQVLTIAPPAVLDDGNPTAAISFPNGGSLRVRSADGFFPLVGIDAGQPVSIQLRFAVTAVGTLLSAGPLDGGVVSAAQNNATIAADGTASIQFQAATQPGLYRIFLEAGGVISALQFWVADPQNNAATPPTVNATGGL